MPLGLLAVLVTQFLSALADNAVLFAAIVLLKSQQAPSWNIPLLQEFFIVAFVLTAPFVGAVADTYPKNRVLLGATLVKLLGGMWLLWGGNPFLAYGLVGLGAALYSPAKYGILSELAPPSALVKSNGWLEGSTIVAILLGTLVGGKLSDAHLQLLMTSVCGTYGLAAIGTLLVPRLPAAVAQKLSFASTVGSFMPALRTLWGHPDAKFSLVGTALFWGVGAVLRFLLIAWVPYVLAIHDNAMVGYLNAASAVGIVVGAALAGRWVTLSAIHRVLPAGVLLGVTVTGFAFVQSLPLAILGLLLIGGLGGFYVVPLNALVQERGHETVGAGRAVAVQNLIENTGMLLMMGLYLLLEARGLSPVRSGAIIGVSLTLAMLSLGQYRLRTAAVLKC